MRVLLIVAVVIVARVHLSETKILDDWANAAKLCSEVLGNVLVAGQNIFEQYKNCDRIYASSVMAARTEQRLLVDELRKQANLKVTIFFSIPNKE